VALSDKDMGKFSMHIQHHKMNQLAIIDRHNRRLNKQYSNDNIDLNRTAFNTTIVPLHESLYRDAIHQIEERVLKKGGRMTKNSVPVTELCFTLPKNVVPEDADRYFSKIVEFLGNVGNKENILHAICHKDETSIHMHLMMVNITRDGRLSRKDIWTKEALKKLHEYLPQYLQMQGFNVERGNPTKTKEAKVLASRSIKQYRADMELKERLEKEILILQSEKEALLDENEELALSIVDEINNYEYSR